MGRPLHQDPYPLVPSFPRPPFPQDVNGVIQSKLSFQTKRHEKLNVATDTLLSFIQSDRPRPKEVSNNMLDLMYHQRCKDEVEKAVEDHKSVIAVENAVGHCRKRLEPEETKRSVGRPAKTAVQEDGDPPVKKRVGKKPTYIVRREKKALLEAELVQLKQHMLRLRKASGIPTGFFTGREQLVASFHDNERLRTESKKQDMLLRNVNAMVEAEYLMKCSKSPIETYIHLTTDLKQRRAELVKLKDSKLAQADVFITERSKFLPRMTSWCQESKFETKEGHYCAEKTDNTPFHGVQSVRQVFEALQFFFKKQKTILPEILGDVTVCEDDDNTVSTMYANHRLISIMSHGVKVEENLVKFFKLVEADVADDNAKSTSFALVAVDSVDIDDMYPYVPQERVRMDINAAMKFTEHLCKKAPKKTRTRHSLYGNGGFPAYLRNPEKEEVDDEFERVVVLTRFFRVKLHHTEMDIPPHVLHEVRQGLTCFTDTMVQSMLRNIYVSR
ncbi:unnamed protein product [Peronospora belbahrii]|uniref:Uncharacterized protein n=1 Tax=Peronospora belbahrii TaxID=622444 RepID=A0AAU9KRK1_9STRA|nr:unnamed protein product [Peronospora belbahrii]